MKEENHDATGGKIGSRRIKGEREGAKKGRKAKRKREDAKSSRYGSFENQERKSLLYLSSSWPP